MLSANAHVFASVDRRTMNVCIKKVLLFVIETVWKQKYTIQDRRMLFECRFAVD